MKLKMEDNMANDWGELSRMTNGKEFFVERIKIKENGIAIQGEFELPPLARISYDDQVFIAMFIRAHGSIKEMEQAFGVSYPTIKGRLNKISEQLGFVQVKPVEPREDILKQLEHGDITPQQAIERMKQ
jgi:hypothetical protein